MYTYVHIPGALYVLHIDLYKCIESIGWKGFMISCVYKVCIVVKLLSFVVSRFFASDTTTPTTPKVQVPQALRHGRGRQGQAWRNSMSWTTWSSWCPKPSSKRLPNVFIFSKDVRFVFAMFLDVCWLQVALDSRFINVSNQCVRYFLLFFGLRLD